MDIKPLKIGDLVARLPIVQGGMGVGVSSSKLAAAVAANGGIGVISGAQIGYTEDDFEKDPLKANLRALKNHIKTAKENAKGGIIGVNLMVALKNYEELAKAAIEAGVDIIFSGAGLPSHLPKIAKGSNVKLAPIVSSLRSANVILKLWDKHHGVAPDALVVEGPKAGGHLGFSKEDIDAGNIDFDKSISDIVELVKTYEAKYNKAIPVIAAGGVFDGYDIAKYLKLGASGAQIATRFVATEECDAHINFKNAYINSKKEDIVIVKSPVGMPGRAIKNAFVERVSNERENIDKCFNCLVPCNPKETPYCITKALINAVNGNVDEGLIFCGENAYRIDRMYTVKELMEELESEIKKA